MAQLNVLIVGASIAGPSCAYWFARAGAKVTVIERFPHLRTNGQNIDIRTAGVTVMRKMLGMEEAVRAKTMQIDGISFVDTYGRPFGTISATGNPEQQSLVSEYEIFRGDLAKILVDLTKDNEDVKYVFAEQVASMQQHEGEDGPIKVEFANGNLPTSEYDLVVACDGATGRTRVMGLNCGARDYVDPTNCWAAYYSVKKDFLEGGRVGKAYSAPGGRFIAVGPDTTGVCRVAMIGVQPRDKRELTLPFREAQKEGTDALKKYVAKHYEGAGWKTDEAIEGLYQADDFYANEVVQVKVPCLYKARFALVGDAGCAPGFTGGGTTLAMTGAYLLAGEICKHKGDLSAGLRAYEERVRPIVTELQKTPPLVPTVMAPQTWWGIWLRNNIFAFIAWTRILEFAQRFFAGAFASSTDDKYKLPDYPWVN